MEKYVKKPEYVEAVQYDGTEGMADALCAEFPGIVSRENRQNGSYTGNLIVESHNKKSTCYSEHFIVKYAPTVFDARSPEAFLELYELHVEPIPAGMDKSELYKLDTVPDIKSENDAAAALREKIGAGEE